MDKTGGLSNLNNNSGSGVIEENQMHLNFHRYKDLIHSIKVSSEIQDELITKVARRAWEKELIGKFQAQYVNNDSLAKASYLVGSKPDARVDDKVLQDEEPGKTAGEPDVSKCCFLFVLILIFIK